VANTFFDYHGDFDLMSYLDTDVPGCSLPQMYFKTSGCWTGGHQENISMSALNINHGPDASEWYTLDLRYVEKLRKELNESK
jgi:histone demethylase